MNYAVFYELSKQNCTGASNQVPSAYFAVARLIPIQILILAIEPNGLTIYVQYAIHCAQ